MNYCVIRLIALMSMVLISSCGQSDSGGDIDVQGDGIPELVDTDKPKAQPQDPAASSAKPNGPASPATCLSECEVPEYAQFKIGAPIEVGPESCSVKNLSIFQAENGIGVLTVADCGQFTNLYHQTVSLDGTDRSEMKLVSDNCESKLYDTKEVASAADDTGVMVVYSCDKGRHSVDVYARYLNHNGTMSQPKLIDSNAETFRVAYNAATSEFGIGRSGKFFRFNREMTQLGGTALIGTKNNYKVRNISALGGDFVIMKDQDWSTKSYCSVVSSGGIPLCDDVEIPSGYFRQVAPKRMMSVASNGDVSLLATMDTQCQTGNPRLIGTTSMRGTMSLGEGISFGGKYGAILIKSGKNDLSIAVASVVSDYSYGATIPAASSTDITSETLINFADQPVVGYVAQEKAFLMVGRMDNGK
jgi:hypothetical protein